MATTKLKLWLLGISSLFPLSAFHFLYEYVWNMVNTVNITQWIIKGTRQSANDRILVVEVLAVVNEHTELIATLQQSINCPKYNNNGVIRVHLPHPQPTFTWSMFFIDAECHIQKKIVLQKNEQSSLNKLKPYNLAIQMILNF